MQKYEEYFKKLRFRLNMVCVLYHSFRQLIHDKKSEVNQ